MTHLGVSGMVNLGADSGGQLGLKLILDLEPDTYLVWYILPLYVCVFQLCCLRRITFLSMHFWYCVSVVKPLDCCILSQNIRQLINVCLCHMFILSSIQSIPVLALSFGKLNYTDYLSFFWLCKKFKQLPHIIPEHCIGSPITFTLYFFHCI